ncbi:MAG: barstar family protein [Lewinellaceae bacterium]|nr:barstar family protein [Sinomicrobium sp.]MCB9292554.1 barstar family protein [Lewinellaceae bacterium]
MDKQAFMELLSEAYGFPNYYAHNLDSAEEIIEDIKEEKQIDKLSLRPFFDALLAQEPEAEREKIWAFLVEHFGMQD